MSEYILIKQTLVSGGETAITSESFDSFDSAYSKALQTQIQDLKTKGIPHYTYTKDDAGIIWYEYRDGYKVSMRVLAMEGDKELVQNLLTQSVFDTKTP